MAGWIKLHRVMLQWEWYDDINVKVTFLHLLLSANHAPKKWRGVDIGRGQLWTSVGNLSKETGLSEKQIRSSLKKLESTMEIEIKGANKGTMVTVCKYDTYQSTEDQQGEQTDKEKSIKGQSNGNQRATNKKVNNTKNEQEGKEVAIALAHPLIKFIQENAPTVNSMKQPLTNEQAEKLLIDLQINTKERKEELKRLIMSMENYVPLKSKSKSANLTIRKWWATEQKSANGGKPTKPETPEERDAREFMEQLKKDTTNLILYGDVQPDNHDQQPTHDGRVQRLSHGSTGNEADKADPRLH